jgi:2-keto-3-deoxy-L-rhamnonate aldolase RhmA
MGNKIKRQLMEGKLCLGSWIQIGHPAVAEVLASTGYDWIAADMEHTDIGIQEFTAIARGLNGSESALLARVRENDTLAIRQVLDAGAAGVIVPLVNSAAEAEKAVRAATFPPAGIRGTAFFRANDYGKRFDDYMKRANDEVVVVVMIETKEAVAAIDEILAVDGVDGVFIGPYDLSLSYGIPGKTSDPVMVDAKRKIVEACRRANKAAGQHLVRLDEASIRAAIDEGFSFMALGMDNLFIESGARTALELARGAKKT